MNGENAIRPCGGELFEGMISLRALLEKAPGSDRKIEKVLYAAERREKQKKEYAFLTHKAEERGFALEILPRRDLEALASGRSHGGVLVLAGPRTFPALTREALENKRFLVMTEGVEDPYNFGYALRSIYASGADAVLLAGTRRFGADATVCRASAGASERLEIYSANEESLRLCKEAGLRVICADLPRSVPVYDADLSLPLVLVVGGERRGLTAPVLETADAVVRLDYGRPFDAALSAASAASILAFEVFRQNRKNF